MKILQLFVFATTTLMMAGCDTDDNVADVQMAVIPDSIPRELMIASFFEPPGHAVLVYNSDSSAAKKINFFSNEKAESQDMVQTGKNKFICKENNTEYEVFETTVLVSHSGEKMQISVNNLPRVEQFDRTDHN